jgi:hypothetical protein
MTELERVLTAWLAETGMAAIPASTMRARAWALRQALAVVQDAGALVVAIEQLALVELKMSGPRVAPVVEALRQLRRTLEARPPP